MVIPVNVLSLHETGTAGLDRLAIEYNGFLVDNSAPADLPARMLRQVAHWSSRKSLAHEWDEFCLSGVRAPWLTAMRDSGLATTIDRSEPVIGIALDPAWRRDELLRRLGRSTRGQIKRSLNTLAKRGSVEIVCADGVETAHDYLARLAELNVERWRHASLRSPYESRRFLEFHRALIARALPRGEVELLALAVAGNPIGYAYNFLWHRAAHHYASGIAADPDRRLKLGYTFHLLLAERYGERGYALYDLMAGDAQYKRSLGKQHDTLYWIRGQRDRAKLRAEAGAVAIKRKVAGLYGRLRSSSRDR
jgi:CelD/BcsL family acetyltransferase involved in cellulose biosynthesis